MTITTGPCPDFEKLVQSSIIKKDKDFIEKMKNDRLIIFVILTFSQQRSGSQILLFRIVNINKGDLPDRLCIDIIWNWGIPHKGCKVLTCPQSSLSIFSSLLTKTMRISLLVTVCVKLYIIIYSNPFIYGWLVRQKQCINRTIKKSHLK